MNNLIFLPNSLTQKTTSTFFTCLLLFSIVTVSAQKQFLNMNSTPENWHERSLSYLRSMNYKFENKLEKTKTDSLVYYIGIAGLYANLGESSDTVFHYIDMFLTIDLKLGCVLFLSNDKLMKDSKDGMFWGKLDPQRHLIRKVKCENYLNSLPKENDEAIKSNPNFDQSMISTIETMMENDQKYRIINQMDKQQFYDDHNRILLDSIFTFYGYPGISKVSEIFSINIAVIFLHMGQEFMEKWMPLLLRTFKAGELDKVSIMFALDRLHTIKYEKQFFGTQRISINGEMVNVPRYTIQEQMDILRKLDLPELFNEVRN